MAVRRIRNHGKWVWLARVAYRGGRKAAYRATKEEARQAEAALLQELKAKAAQAEQDGQRPATLRQLCEFYLADLQARGKGPETTGRAIQTARAVERILPEALDRPLSTLGDRDVFTFRRARDREGSKPALATGQIPVNQSA